MGNTIDKLIKISHTYYRSLQPINCPALQETVIFNRHGWKHLLYDSHDHRRNNACIKLRLFLLPDARQIIKTAKKIIDTSTINNPRIQKVIKYFEIRGKSIRTHRCITVIIRQVNSGNYHYFSIRRCRK